jgi:hypothetical protein
MDVLRSCYSTSMQFSPGGPNVPVDWFWCPPGAKYFTNRHTFGSLVWDGGQSVGTHTIGEVPGAPRVWRNGSIPGPYPGDHPAGPLASFVSGCSGQPDLPWSGGMPTACAVPLPTACWYTQGTWSHVLVHDFHGTFAAVSQYPTGSDLIYFSGSRSFRVFTFCSIASPPHPDGQNLEIQVTDFSTSSFFYGLANIVDLVHRTYTWHTVANQPAGWPGGDVVITLS